MQVNKGRAMGITQTPVIKTTVEQVNSAVAQAGGIQKQQMTEKQIQKQAEKRKRQTEQYWNTMISRKEAYQVVQQAIQQEQEKARLMFIQIKTLTNFLVEKGMTTQSELDELSKPIVESIYGKAPQETNPDNKEE